MMDLHLEEKLIHEEIARQNEQSGILSFTSAYRWFDSSSKDTTLLKRMAEQEMCEEEKNHFASSPTELHALSCFSYLEQRSFISKDKEFFFIDLLKKIKSELEQGVEYKPYKAKLEEAALLYIELLRINFPLGNKLDHGELHKEIAETFEIKAAGDRNEEDEKKIRLITRVFSLIDVNEPKKWTSKKKRVRVVKREAIDYEVAMFNTYLNQVRSTLQNYMRSVIFLQYLKMGEQNTKEIKNLPLLDRELPFEKFSGAFMGVLVKDILVHEDINLGINYNISKGEILENIEKGFMLWTLLLQINKAITDRQPEMADFVTKFNEASEFLVDRIKKLNEQQRGGSIQVSIDKIRKFLDANEDAA